MSKKPFDKFINKVESGAKKKERIRQEKKKVRAEKNAYFDEQKKLAWERRTGVKSPDTGYKKGVTASTGKRTENKETQTENRRQGAGNKNQGTGYKKQDAGYRIQNAGIKKDVKQIVGGKKDISKHKNNSNDTNTRLVPKPISKNIVPGGQKPVESNEKPGAGKPFEEQMPLNKFIAWSGVCGRREAADLIKAGKIMVNNKVVTEPPHRVSQQDNIKLNGKRITIQKNLVYILLNKPKDYITTTDDPEGRKTVMDLIKRATTERVFPVGRLDRNTTGVLLLTNDGELAQRLTHPKYQVKKIYEVRLDKVVTKNQLDTIATGITLEDGFIQPDAVAYADAQDKSVIGIEIHSGRNRLVRRIFEHLGFKVKNLDRVMYGIFTKKNVERGKWRLLTEKEIRLLKHLNTSFINKKPS